MDDEDDASVFTQLGLERDTAITEIPDSLWESMLATATDPNTPAADASLVPDSDTVDPDEDDDLELDLGDADDAHGKDHSPDSDAAGTHHLALDDAADDSAHHHPDHHGHDLDVHHLESHDEPVDEPDHFGGHEDPGAGHLEW